MLNCRKKTLNLIQFKKKNKIKLIEILTKKSVYDKKKSNMNFIENGKKNDLVLTIKKSMMNFLKIGFIKTISQSR